MKFYPLLPLVWFLLTFGSLSAGHINGGYMNVEVLSTNSNGQIKIKLDLVLHRDCSCTNCASFDENPSIGIYLMDENTNLEELSQESIFRSRLLSLSSIKTINPLFDVGQACLEEGKYEAEESLPLLTRPDQFYYILYQRCCRSELISNLAAPDDTGITVGRIINYESTLVENKGVELSNSFNPFVKAGEAFELTIPFFNSEDQDSVSYQFCSPLNGGGKVGAQGFPGDPNSCSGVSPSPACPVLNDTVQYTQGLSAQQPVLSPSLITLDISTGMLNGIINQIGTFQIGICAQKYRDGILLSETRFDFPILSIGEAISNTSEVDETKMYITPNPSNGLFQASGLNLDQLNSIRIIDLYGKEVDFGVEAFSPEKVNIRLTQKGVFFVSWNDGNRIKSQKVIVQ